VIGVDIDREENTYGSRWQLYKEIILPGAMPSILVGLRFALGLVWVLLLPISIN
jgi:ABC-type nitrate/sulfonate/bicarbonate transport system permease component